MREKHSAKRVERKKFPHKWGKVNQKSVFNSRNRRDKSMIHMYNILNLLYHNDMKSKLVAATQKQIQEELANNGTKLCDRTVYNNIRKLVKQGLIEEGLPRGNAKSYYVTTAGVEWMREVEKEVCE